MQWYIVLHARMSTYEVLQPSVTSGQSRHFWSLEDLVPRELAKSGIKTGLTLRSFSFDELIQRSGYARHLCESSGTHTTNDMKVVRAS